MGVYKEGKNWKVQVYYKDWQGNRKRKQKRGFRTKGEAKEWERDFLQQQTQSVEIEFGNFLELYYKDMEVRLRENTMYTKRYIIDLKIKPYFEHKVLSEITVADIRNWQNELLKQNYSETYLKTINCQLGAIFNYAVRYYNLKDNPCRKAGSIGKSKGEPKDFWMLATKSNAQCVMCSHYYEFNDCGAEASDIALRELDSLLPYCKLVLLNGYGEPFISKHFIQCLRLLNKYCVKAIVTTNLSILTDEMCELIPGVFDEINISCNGYNKETYEKIHRGLRFDTFSDNLMRLVNVCDSAKLALSCVVMVETVKWASDIIRFAHEKGIKKVRFGRLGVSSFIRNYDQDPTNYPTYVAHHLKEAKRLADEYQIEMIYPENYRMNIEQDALIDETRKVAAIKFRYDEKYQAELRDEFKLYHSQGTYGCIEQKLDSTDIACSGMVNCARS